MRRFDLRHLEGGFESQMAEVVNDELVSGEVAIFLIHIGKTKEGFARIEVAHKLLDTLKATLLNSLRFNEVDWSITIKKVIS